jgi:hypothetical protein
MHLRIKRRDGAPQGNGRGVIFAMAAAATCSRHLSSPRAGPRRRIMVGRPPDR